MFSLSRSVTGVQRISGRFLIGVALLLCGTLSAEVSSYDLDSAGLARAQLLLKEVGRAPSLAEQFALLGRAYEESHARGDFERALYLAKSGRRFAKLADDRADAFESYYEFLGGLATDNFAAQERAHYRWQIAALRAFDGHINHAESELYALLELDADEIDLETRYSTFYMLAYCNYYVGNLERSVDYSRSAALGFLRIGDDGRAMEGFDGLSTTFFKLNQIDSAIHYARKGLALVGQGHGRSAYNLYLNYAEALMADNRLDSAFYYANRSSELIGGKRSAARARISFCLANINNRAKRYSDAVEHYEEAVAYFSRTNETYHLAEVLDSLRAVHIYRGDYRLAYDAAMRSFATRDSLREDRVQKDNERIAAEHERDVLAKELEASKGERALARAIVQKQKSERIAIVGLVAFLLGAIAFVVYRIRIRRKLTDRLQAEVDAQTAELRKHGEKLEEQAALLKQSNEELERFAYIASHDLKTPIRNINSFLGLVQRRLPVESRAIVGEYLDIAMASTRQMSDLVTDVLEFSRVNADLASISTEASVVEVVGRVRTTMQRELDERQARIVCDGDATVVLPKGTLDQILGNLIGNGLKYNDSAAPLIRVVSVDMGDTVRITVTDNGIGIAEEFYDKVFEVFRRLHTSDKYTGTGVGLASRKKVVDRIGGSISLESEVGIGTTFTVDLPKSTLREAAGQEASAVGSAGE